MAADHAHYTSDGRRVGISKVSWPTGRLTLVQIPGLTGTVPRYTHIRYRGLTPGGQSIEREATGFHARVVQHECDHLDGILYPMRMTDLSLLVFNEELRHFDDGDLADRDGAAAAAVEDAAAVKL